jgi:hypothetical protein
VIEDREEGGGGRTEERMLASGEVWYEAPESVIHSVRTSGLRHGVLIRPPKPCRMLGGVGGGQDGMKRAAPTNMAVGGA